MRTPTPIGAIVSIMTDRPTKITFAEMRDMGVRGLLVDCSDYKCSHLITMSGDRWPDDMRLSDLQPRFGFPLGFWQRMSCNQNGQQDCHSLTEKFTSLKPALVACCRSRPRRWISVA